MLEIQEKFSSDGYENVIAEAGSKNLHITEAMDKNNVIGFIAYAYNDDAVIIYDFDDGGDLYLCDGLVRSVLFKGCLKGLDSAVFEVKDKTKFARLKSLSFVKDNHKILDNMNEFMDKCKKCKEIR
mgnify:FL=1